MSQQEHKDRLNSLSQSPSTSPPVTSTDIIPLQKELKDKENELNIAYQTSLELIETNNELQQQFEEQSVTIQNLDANILDCDMKIDLLEAENQEYQQTVIQTNEKYEQLLGELAVTREHLNNTKEEINEYQMTIQALNHNIIHHSTAKTGNNKMDSRRNGGSKVNKNEIDYKERWVKQQKKYDELLRECERLRNENELFYDAQIEIENMKKDQMKLEKRNKLLSDQIVELTYNNVQLEKEINDNRLDIDEQSETIKYLQTENQNLMTKKLISDNKNTINNISVPAEPHKIDAKKRLYSSYGGPDSTLSTFVNNKGNNDLKRRLSVQLRDNFGYNSKLVMFANNIDENGVIEEENGGNSEYNMQEMIAEEDDDVYGIKSDDENMDGNLLTMVQNYDNNDEYLMNAEMEDSLSDLHESPPQPPQNKEVSPQSKIIDKPRKGSGSSTGSGKTTQNTSPSNTANPRRVVRKSKGKKRSYPRKKQNYRNTDALDEYLHLTASAVKINYPTVNATSKELIEMVKSLPFYQAHDHLNRYMMDRLRWEQIQQNKLLQLKAAAIQSQRDHEMTQQSTVTRLFKKWFTSEYDDVDDIIMDRTVNKGQIDLSSPLSKKENMRLNRVGKAKIQHTKSGGTSVNLGSLNPKGTPPKGTNRKKRIIKSHSHTHSKPRHRHRNAYADQSRKRKKRDKKLKSLSTTQTLPSERINDKNVQKMLEINAEYIDKVIQDEQQKRAKSEPKPTIILTVPVKGRKEPIYNAEPNGNMNGKRKQKRVTHTQTHTTQKQGWISWLTGAPPPPMQQRVRDKSRKKRDIVRDPYALGGNAVKKKSKKSKKSAKGKGKRKVRSPKSEQKEMDISAHIKSVITHSKGSDDDVDAKEVTVSEKVTDKPLKLNNIAEFEIKTDDLKGNQSKSVSDDIQQNDSEILAKNDVSGVTKIDTDISDDIPKNDSEILYKNDAKMDTKVVTDITETDLKDNTDIISDESKAENLQIHNDDTQSNSDKTEDEPMQDITTQIFDNTSDNSPELSLPNTTHIPTTNDIKSPSNISSTVPSPITNDANVDIIPIIEELSDPYALDRKSSEMDHNSDDTDCLISQIENDRQMDVIESNLNDNSDIDDVLRPVTQVKDLQ